MLRFEYSALQIVREFVFRVHTGPLIFIWSARSYGFSFLIGAYPMCKLDDPICHFFSSSTIHAIEDENVYYNYYNKSCTDHGDWASACVSVLSACRRVGALVCRRVGMSVHWHVGALVCRCVGVSVHWRVGALACRHVG